MPFAISGVIDDITADPDLKLRRVIADTLERHTLKGMVSHAGKHSCESCVATAKTVPSVHWPLSTMTGRLRKEAELQYSAE